MNTLRATRITAGGRRGSSRPVIVDTDAGPRFVKLRGAAQGTGPLVAEVVVAALAEAIGLAVPSRSLISIEANIETLDHNDELADLLAASVGISLGFAYLDGARDMRPSDIANIDVDTRTAILWLDRLVLNPDRTARNPNLLAWHGRTWLIDHGAALGFQYDWPQVTESAPRRAGTVRVPHLLADLVSPDDLVFWDELLATRLTRDTLESAVGEVPNTFLEPLVAVSEGRSSADSLRRRRAAYVAYLWKRLQGPRPFV